MNCKPAKPPFPICCWIPPRRQMPLRVPTSPPVPAARRHSAPWRTVALLDTGRRPKSRPTSTRSWLSVCASSKPLPHPVGSSGSAPPAPQHRPPVPSALAGAMAWCSSPAVAALASPPSRTTHRQVAPCPQPSTTCRSSTITSRRCSRWINCYRRTRPRRHRHNAQS